MALKLRVFSKTLFLMIWAMVFATLPVLGQAPAPKMAESADEFFGVVRENTYRNEFFGFSLPIPPTFSVLDHRQSAVYANAGVDMLKDENSTRNKALDYSAAKQATLLGVLEKPIGSLENSILEIAVTKQQSGVTANMALAASMSLMTSTGKLKLKQSVPNPVFGQLRFAGAVVTGEYNTVKIDQEMYVVMRKGYSVHIALTYSTDEGRKRLIGILEKIQFSKQ